MRLIVSISSLYESWGSKADIYRLLTLNLLIVPKEVGAKPNIEGGSIEPTSDPIDLV